MELYQGRFVFRADGRATTANCRAEEKLHVNRNYHPDHSDHRLARWLQRRRRRAVLRHRLLRRRRPWPRHRDPADPAAAWKTLTPRTVITTQTTVILRSPALARRLEGSPRPPALWPILRGSPRRAASTSG